MYVDSTLWMFSFKPGRVCQCVKIGAPIEANHYVVFEQGVVLQNNPDNFSRGNWSKKIDGEELSVQVAPKALNLDLPSIHLHLHSLLLDCQVLVVEHKLPDWLDPLCNRFHLNTSTANVMNSNCESLQDQTWW